MTMRGFESVGVRAVIVGLPEYLSGARAITTANVGISKSLTGLDVITNGFKLLAGAVVGASAVIGGAAVASSIKYETTLAKINALTNTNAEDTAKLGEGILKLSRTVPKSPDELGAAAYFALSSGIDNVNDALATVQAAAKASAAGLGSTADIVDIVTAALNAYGKENLTAARATDILVATVREGKGEPAQMANALGTLLPLAAALKVPFEDLAAVFASLTNALGGSGGAELAATQLRGILSQLASPSKEAKNALAEAEAGVKTLSQEEIELADAHKGVVSASTALSSAQRGVRDAAEGVEQAQRGVRDALEGSAQAHKDTQHATEALRNAYADLTTAQRAQSQASLDARRETLSVLEAEQGLLELRTQQGSHAQEVAAAELALAQAREDANSKNNKTSLQQKQAALAVQQAELRLNQVRAQGPRFALDLQNAELRLEEARLRQGDAQRAQDKRVADAKKDVRKASDDLSDAYRAEGRASERVADANRGLRNAYEGQADARANVARSAEDLALAQQKELLANIHTRDAYADLRKEIAEKGLIPTLQRLNTLFEGNVEGLAKLFPDVRGFIGFLSAINSQGPHTATILDNIKKSAGLTDEAFDKMSKTTAFQAQLIKTNLNVALIELGNVALPAVNAGFAPLVKNIPIIGDFFKKGLNGTQIGGDLDTIEKAAFNVGVQIRNLFDFIKDNKDATLLPTGKLFLEGLQTAAQWFIDHKEAIAAAFFIFAVTNPIWAGILAGGAIITGIGLLGAAIDDLTDPLLRVRRELDRDISRFIDFINTVGTLGLNKTGLLPKDLAEPFGSREKFDADARAIDAELARRKKASNDAAEAARQLKQDQDEAVKAGVPYLDFLKKQIEDYIAAGGTKMDDFLDRLLTRYEALPGADRDWAANLRANLKEAAPAAADLATNLALVNPPAVGDAGQGAIEAAVAASLDLGRDLSVIKPPDVGDAGLQVIDAATAAAQDEERAIEAIPEPDVGDAGKAAIDAATRSAGYEFGILAAIKRPNVGDAGKRDIDLATTAALSLASALGQAAANASKIKLGSFIGSLVPKAFGGIVRQPEIAIMGEGHRPEAILPLTDPRRSRDILSTLPPGLLAQMIPVQKFDSGGVNVGTSSLAGGRSPYDVWAAFAQYFGPRPRGYAMPGEGPLNDFPGGFLSPASTRSSLYNPSFGGFQSPAAPQQITVTLPPSLIRSMQASNGGGVTIENLIGGDITIGSTSAEVESLAIAAIQSVFRQARTSSRLSSSLVGVGVG